jgi:uncharacterized repeat protein (TIGR03803 family)
LAVADAATGSTRPTAVGGGHKVIAAKRPLAPWGRLTWMNWGLVTPGFHFLTKRESPTRRGNLNIRSTVGLLCVGTIFVAAMSLASAAWTTARGKAPLLKSTWPVDGASPDALVQGRDGNLYGAAAHGGKRSAKCPAGCGTLFKINSLGELTVLRVFTGGSDGQVPLANGLLPASDGGIYGVTSSTFFKMTAAGMLTTLHEFTSGVVPPYGSLVESRDGNFYGGSCCSVMKISPVGTLTILNNFPGRWGPVSLLQGSDGSLYGTTGFGGRQTNYECPNGCGTVFKITPPGELTTLHGFAGGTDEKYPSGNLVEGPDGSFYGMTGSALSGDCDAGCGAIFKITPSGALTTLYSFTSESGSGLGGLVLGPDGNLYGVAVGRSGTGGAIFKITPSGAMTTLHVFTGVSDDNDPDSRYPEPRNLDPNGAGPGNLVLGRDGNFYGTTGTGGCDRPVGCGTVFKITTSGIFTTLHTFSGGLDGNDPVALIQGSDGSFYGITQFGGYSPTGCFSGCGTVFKITASGEFKNLYRFGGNK